VREITVGSHRRSTSTGTEDHGRQHHHPPTLLLILHMAKTGGTTLTTLISGYSWGPVKVARETSGVRLRLPLLIPSGGHACFLHLFPSIFPRARRHAQGKSAQQCASRFPKLAAPSSWSRHDLAVEFHTTQDLEAFWREVEPALPALRMLYAAHNGTLLTTTSVRDAASVIRSTYKMWPPIIPESSPEVQQLPAGVTSTSGPFQGRVLPFSYYLETREEMATGPLTKALLADHRRDVWGRQRLPFSPGKSSKHRAGSISSSGGSAGAFNCTTAVRAAARRRLHAFDIVGVTECTRHYWRQLGARLGWSNLVDEDIMDAAEARGKGVVAPGFDQNAQPLIRAFVQASADEELSPAATAALSRAASCDAPLHADGIRMAGLLWSKARGHGHGTSGTAPLVGEEEEWVAEAQHMLVLADGRCS
jgi:hypothetical protein